MEGPGDKLSITDFAAKIKSKYPEYKDVNDTVLVQKIVDKYPDYSANVDMGSLKKKSSGQTSGAPVSPTQSKSPLPAAPKYEFGKGSLVGTPGSPVQMPGQEVDQTVHEDDPVATALQPHLNTHSKLVNEYNNSGINQRQVSESTSQRSRPQQMIVGGNGSYKENLQTKLTKAANDVNNTYDAVVESVLPNVDAAKSFLDKTAQKNKGEIPENNRTANIAIQKIQDFQEREKNIASSGDLTTAAVNEAIRNNPELGKQIETIKKERPGVDNYKDLLPGAMVGRLVHNFVEDKDNQDVFSHHPEWLDKFYKLAENNLTDNPEYGAVVVANELSRARHEAGKNNPVANAIIGSSSYMDKLAEKMYKDDPQKMAIYNDIVKKDFNKYIDTKDFLSGFAEGGKGVFKGIKNTVKELTGGGSDAESAYNELRDENEQVSSGAKGIYEYTDPAGKMTGMVAAMIGTGGVLKGVGMGEKLANGVNVAGTFWGDEKNKFRLKYPGEKLKQNLGATLMTSAYLVAPNAVPANKISKLMSGLRPEMESISDQLINGTLTKQAAKSKAMYAFEQALNFGKAVGKQEVKGITEMVAITGFGQVLDKALGLTDSKMSKYHPDGELKDVAKTMLIGNAIPSAMFGLAGIKSRPYTKESLYELANNPKRIQNVLHDQLLSDPEAHASIEAKLQDLDHLVRTKTELDAHTDLTIEQKKQYILHDYNEKLLTQKAETITNEHLKSKIEDQIKKSKEIKENIFKGKGTDVLPQEDHLTAKEYKEVADIKNDEELFDYFVAQKKEGYATTLKAASDMEDKKAGVKAGLEYMTDKAVENPVLFRERWGSGITDKILSRVATKDLQKMYMTMAEKHPDDPAVAALEQIIEERYEKDEVSDTKESEDIADAETGETIQPAKESQKVQLKLNEQSKGVRADENHYPYDILDGNGEKIGNISYNYRPDLGGYQVEGVKIDNTGQGVGKEVYKQLINKLDKPLISDSSLTPYAKKLWESLKRDGLAAYDAETRKYTSIKPKENAVEIQKPNAVDVRQPSGDGSKVGEGNTEPPIPPGKENQSKSEGEEDLTRLTHADTEKIYQESGLPERLETPTKHFEELKQEAQAKLEKGYDYADVAKRTMEGDYKFEDTDQLLFAKRVADLKAKQKNMSVTSKEFDAAQNEIEMLSRASDVAGTIGGRFLQSRKNYLPTEESISDDLLQKKQTLGVDELTDAQKEEAAKLFTADEKATKAYDEKIAKLEQENAKLKAAAEVKKMRSQSPEKMTHEQRVEQRKKSLEDARAALLKIAKGEGGAMSSIPLLPQLIAIAPHVKDYAKSLVAEGIDNLPRLVKAIHDEFKNILDGITEKDIHNILAGEYNEKKPTRTQLAIQMHDLKTEASLINKLEKLEAGGEPKSEKEKIERNKQLADLRKKIKEHDVTKLAEYKSKVQSQISKVEEQIKKGNFSKEAPAEPLKLDKEALELQDKLIEARNRRALAKLRDYYAGQSKYEKGMRYAAEILNIPRAIMSSTDLSAMLRQGVISSASHPIMAAKAAGEMIKSAVSQKTYDRWFFELQKMPRYKDMMETRLGITDSTNPNLQAREELFMSNLAEKIPVIGQTLKIKGKTVIPGLNLIKGSERAYSMFLNKIRVDLYNRFADAMEERGLTVQNSPKQYKAMADYVNNQTGRGSVSKSIEPVIPFLNTIFFSPRLIASRINMLTYLAQPRFYRTVPKEVRMAYFKDMAKFVGVGLTVLTLAKLNGAEVEDDPRSSDFGKIKVGNTRWDIWGGFQPYARTAAQVATGQRKSTNTGKMYELDGKGPFGQSRGNVIANFGRGKLSPVLGTAIDFLSGRTMVGDKIVYKWKGKAGEKGISDILKTNLLPMTATGMEEALKDQGTKAWFTVGVPSVFGVGTQVYDSKQKKK